jgi:nicotinamidase-related amidase
MGGPTQAKGNTETGTALLLIDVISHFDFKDGGRILRQALPIAKKLATLKARASDAGIPVIYVNDHFGDWHSEASRLLEFCLRPEAKGRAFVQAVRPGEQDYFVLKPLHSAFYQTALEALLQYLGVTTLILTGLTTNSCITCTAHDANMREFRIFIPADCCAARTKQEHKRALEHLEQMADANIESSEKIDFKRLLGASQLPKARRAARS